MHIRLLKVTHVSAKSYWLSAHILPRYVFANFILNSIHLADEERAAMNGMIIKMSKSVILTVQDHPHFKSVSSNFKQILKKEENNGPTAKLMGEVFMIGFIYKTV